MSVERGCGKMKACRRHGTSLRGSPMTEPIGAGIDIRMAKMYRARGLNDGFG